MNPSQLLLYALLIVLLYLVYTYIIKGSSNKLTNLLPAGTPYVVSEDSINTLNKSQQVFNYTTSIWIYIDNWDVTPTLKKPILNIANAMDLYLGSIDNNLFVDIYPFSEIKNATTATPVPGTTTQESFLTAYELEPAPFESLTSMDVSSKKRIKEPLQSIEEGYSKVTTSGTIKKAGKEPLTTNALEAAAMTALSSLTSIRKFTAVVPGVPLQSWTNITISIHDKALDIYINGKLTQSNLIPFVPSPVNKSITITPQPGFIGWTSNFQYYPYNLTPSQIDNIYKAGYTGSPESLLSLLGKYSMKVVFVDNTQQPQ